MERIAGVIFSNPNMGTEWKINPFQCGTLFKCVLLPNVFYLRKIHIFEGRAVPKVSIHNLQYWKIVLLNMLLRMLLSFNH